ncbi:unnamed protein product [Euphydryas editha]|uniref:Integrase catalytic domain-containing protein n=1 Tax=Euphydryas editha TaxID=104508 RepID=A0AAU9TP59_EUPED|nr:unnamed protein product [Euphydryas editha]
MISDSDFKFKCLHLEAVSDLSKDGFLQAFRRFISRRGKPAEVYCDNGKNFVAAAKEIVSLSKTRLHPLSKYTSAGLFLRYVTLRKVKRKHLLKDCLPLVSNKRIYSENKEIKKYVLTVSL